MDRLVYVFKLFYYIVFLCLSKRVYRVVVHTWQAQTVQNNIPRDVLFQELAATR